jgi:hypothetical protein
LVDNSNSIKDFSNSTFSKYIMDLTDKERRFMELYTNYSTNYNNLEFRKLDEQWTSDGTKESMWISIYTKLPIDTHIKQLLFNNKFDEQTIISELESHFSNTFF